MGADAQPQQAAVTIATHSNRGMLMAANWALRGEAAEEKAEPNGREAALRGGGPSNR